MEEAGGDGGGAAGDGAGDAGGDGGGDGGGGGGGDGGEDAIGWQKIIAQSAGAEHQPGASGNLTDGADLTAAHVERVKQMKEQRMAKKDADDVAGAVARQWQAGTRRMLEEQDKEGMVGVPSGTESSDMELTSDDQSLLDSPAVASAKKKGSARTTAATAAAAAARARRSEPRRLLS